MNQVYTARDVMSASVFTLTPDAGLYKAIDALVARQAPSAPVVDESNRLVGIQRLQHAVEMDRMREDHTLKEMQNPRTISEMQHLAATQKRVQLAALLTQRHSK